MMRSAERRGIELLFGMLWLSHKLNNFYPGNDASDDMPLFGAGLKKSSLIDKIP